MNGMKKCFSIACLTINTLLTWANRKIVNNNNNNNVQMTIFKMLFLFLSIISIAAVDVSFSHCCVWIDFCVWWQNRAWQSELAFVCYRHVNEKGTTQYITFYFKLCGLLLISVGCQSNESTSSIHATDGAQTAVAFALVGLCD